MVSLLTGVFTAFKINELKGVVDFNDFSFITLVNGSIYTFSIFLKRYLSMLIMLGLILLVSLSKYTSFIGYLLISYRAFLLTMNIALIIIYLGLGGAINAIIIILPCQLVELLLLTLMYIVATNACKRKCETGRFGDEYFKCLLFFLIVSLIISLLEMILLFVFKTTTILII